VLLCLVAPTFAKAGPAAMAALQAVLLPYLSAGALPQADRALLETAALKLVGAPGGASSGGVSPSATLALQPPRPAQLERLLLSLHVWALDLPHLLALARRAGLAAAVAALPARAVGDYRTGLAEVLRAVLLALNPVSAIIANNSNNANAVGETAPLLALSEDAPAARVLNVLSRALAFLAAVLSGRMFPGFAPWALASAAAAAAVTGDPAVLSQPASVNGVPFAGPGAVPLYVCRPLLPQSQLAAAAAAPAPALPTVAQLTALTAVFSNAVEPRGPVIAPPSRAAPALALAHARAQVLALLCERTPALAPAVSYCDGPTGAPASNAPLLPGGPFPYLSLALRLAAPDVLALLLSVVAAAEATDAPAVPAGASVLPGFVPPVPLSWSALATIDAAAPAGVAGAAALGWVSDPSYAFTPVPAARAAAPASLLYPRTVPAVSTGGPDLAAAAASAGPSADSLPETVAVPLAQVLAAGAPTVRALVFSVLSAMGLANLRMPSPAACDADPASGATAGNATTADSSARGSSSSSSSGSSAAAGSGSARTPRFGPIGSPAKPGSFGASGSGSAGSVGSLRASVGPLAEPTVVAAAAAVAPHVALVAGFAPRAPTLASVAAGNGNSPTGEQMSAAAIVAAVTGLPQASAHSAAGSPLLRASTSALPPALSLAQGTPAAAAAAAAAGDDLAAVSRALGLSRSLVPACAASSSASAANNAGARAASAAAAAGASAAAAERAVALLRASLPPAPVAGALPLPGSAAAVAAAAPWPAASTLAALAFTYEVFVRLRAVPLADAPPALAHALVLFACSPAWEPSAGAASAAVSEADALKQREDEAILLLSAAPPSVAASPVVLAAVEAARLPRVGLVVYTLARDYDKVISASVAAVVAADVEDQGTQSSFHPLNAAFLPPSMTGRAGPANSSNANNNNANNNAATAAPPVAPVLSARAARLAGDLFEYLAREPLSQRSRGRDRRALLLGHLVSLVRICPGGAARVALLHLAHEHDRVIEALEGHPLALFLYLSSLMAAREFMATTARNNAYATPGAPPSATAAAAAAATAAAGAPADAPMLSPVTGKTSRALSEMAAFSVGNTQPALTELLEATGVPFTPKLNEQFVRLLCVHAPAKVLPHLLAHHSYNIDTVLRLCQQHNIADASAYLLERTGDVAAALGLHLGSVQAAARALRAHAAGAGESLERALLIAAALASDAQQQQQQPKPDGGLQTAAAAPQGVLGAAARELIAAGQLSTVGPSPARAAGSAAAPVPVADAVDAAVAAAPLALQPLLALTPRDLTRTLDAAVGQCTALCARTPDAERLWFALLDGLVHLYAQAQSIDPALAGGNSSNAAPAALAALGLSVSLHDAKPAARGASAAAASAAAAGVNPATGLPTSLSRAALAAVSQLLSWHLSRSVQQALLGMDGHVTVRALLTKLTADHAGDAVGPFRASLTDMLSSCAFEGRNLGAALGLLAEDRARLLRTRVRAQARALGPAAGCRCQGCTGPLFGPLLRRRGGLAHVHACGHSWHADCARGFAQSAATGAGAAAATAAAAAGEECPLCAGLDRYNSAAANGAGAGVGGLRSGAGAAGGNNGLRGRGQSIVARAGAAADPASPANAGASSSGSGSAVTGAGEMAQTLVRLHSKIEVGTWATFALLSSPVVGAHARPLHEVESAGGAVNSSPVKGSAGAQNRDTSEKSGFLWF